VFSHNVFCTEVSLWQLKITANARGCIIANATDSLVNGHCSSWSHYIMHIDGWKKTLRTVAETITLSHYCLLTFMDPCEENIFTRHELFHMKAAAATTIRQMSGILLRAGNSWLFRASSCIVTGIFFGNSS